MYLRSKHTDESLKNVQIDPELKTENVLVRNDEIKGIGNGGMQKLRLYDAATYALKAEFECQGPVLDCCFHDDSSGYSAGADHSLSRY